MDGLYQTPYLPQNTDYQPNMYRPSHTHLDHHDSNDAYWQHHHHPMHPYPSIQTPPPPPYSYYGPSSTTMPLSRPKITTNVWEDEATLCFQVDAKGICVARRQDNDMINGTKLLNVVGMSRGKRDGILKNEKGRVVVKVGAMHLKGVWIPFQRARELAAKFKILDVLFPLFADEPTMYLPSVNNTDQHSSTDKCNMVSSPLPAFNHRSDDVLPNWERPYHHGMMHHHPPSHYDDFQQHQGHQQVLHRASLPELSNGGNPLPRSVNQTHPEETDLYLLNNNNSHSSSNNNTSNTPYDYYHRQFGHPASHNRGSFSSVSSHQSYLYPTTTSLNQDDNDTSKASSIATPSSYNLDNHTISNSNNNSNTHHHNYSSRLCHEKSIYPRTYTKYTQDSSAITDAPPVIHRTASAGSTTPSSWFSPETPTAVLFQQKDKDEVVTNSNNKRKASVDSSSPSLRATRRLKVVELEQD